VRVVQATHAQREAIVDQLLERFYAHALAFPEVQQLLDAEPQRLARLQELHRAHFLTLEPGTLDVAPLATALRGPEAPSSPIRGPQWYVGLCSVYLAVGVSLLVEAMRDSEDLIPAVQALIKTVMHDLSLALETHIGESFVPRQTATELARSITAATDALRRAQDTARSRDELVNMLVHDLRNPVQGIALQASVTLQIASKSLEMERDHLAQIERTCRDLSCLLQNMLEVAGLEVDQMPVAVEPTLLGDLVNDVLDQYLSAIERAGIRLTRALDADVPTIRADPGLLRRVLMNLIVNAVRHSGTPEIRVESAAEGSVVCARVIDYGTGIPLPDQERIFDKFHSGARVSQAGDAIGLGLYFCRLATERMGGRLRLASEPGLTVFEVRLPAE
jgi:two-component system sensor histidine kinase/response regulator